jgi:hypothetical protein
MEKQAVDIAPCHEALHEHAAWIWTIGQPVHDAIERGARYPLVPVSLSLILDPVDNIHLSLLHLLMKQRDWLLFKVRVDPEDEITCRVHQASHQGTVLTEMARIQQDIARSYRSK